MISAFKNLKLVDYGFLVSSAALTGMCVNDIVAKKDIYQTMKRVDYNLERIHNRMDVTVNQLAISIFSLIGIQLAEKIPSLLDKYVYLFSRKSGPPTVVDNSGVWPNRVKTHKSPKFKKN